MVSDPHGPSAKSTLSAPPAHFDLPALEEDILGFWAKNDVVGRSLRTGAQTGSDAGKTFVFYDGPPFATGLPHYGHLLAGTIKDIVPRFWSMRGHAVERRFGWDCHGLPIESLVQRDLDLQGKAQIEAYGIRRFNDACRSGVLRFTREWEQIVRRIGRWVDFENDYKTMDITFMESVWWVFKSLWDKGLIYEGYRVQPVSPSLGTPLSNFEVALGPQERDPVTRKEGHKRVSDPSITVRFRLEDEDATLWAWTTTPWTLPSNLALAVHPDFDYVRVRVVDTGEVAYLEPSLLGDYQGRGRIGEVEELGRVKGRDLVGRPYEPLFPYFERYRTRDDGRRWAFRVVGAEYVTVDSGTGIVHQAPAFGEEDYEIGQREGLPMVNPLNLGGVFDETVTDFAGMFVKDADKGIVAKLEKEGRLVDHETVVHPYPHCYRTDQPLLYMALSTWFMRVEPLRDRLVEHNKKIRWVPAHVGSGRFGNWLEGARDWNLARNRYWGTPIPLWRCDENPDEIVCVGSIRELEELAGLEPGSVDDLHRESIDSITFPSKTTPGATMRRVSEVFDCWFESGSMPYAQNHYPFDETKREYVEDNLPADFIAEGLDQTRGWFYTLHVLSTALFDRPAYSNVIVNGMVLAADGKKMSKRLKNYPDPVDLVGTYGADALRAYLINSAVVKAEPMRFGKHAKDTSGEGVRDTIRTAILPLWNAYNFLSTYARADGWSPKAADLEISPAGELDRWILSRVQGFVEELTREFEAYALSNLVPACLRVCDDMNNWYIRRGRRRYWRRRGEDARADQDKADAYGTLFRALMTVARAIAPVMPFLAEWLYQRLMTDTGLGQEGSDSVHLGGYPEVDHRLRDETLERRVAVARRAVALGMVVRERERVAVRRPLPAVTIASPDPFVRDAVRSFEGEVIGELNVRRLEVLQDDSDLAKLSAKANFRRLGKRLGKKMKALAAEVQGLDREALRVLADGGEVEIMGERICGDDVFIVREPLPGRSAEAAEGMTVVIDTKVDESLRREGLAREVVNRVQSLRKRAKLDVSDRIRLTLTCGERLAVAIADPALQELIRGETLAEEIDHDVSERPEMPHQVRDEIDGEPLVIGLEVLSGAT